MTRIRSTVLSAALTAALTAGITLAVPATSAQAAGGSIKGTWSGPVFGDAGASAGYTGVVKIKQKNGRFSAKVSYPEYNCTGTWTFKGRKGKTYTFVENISKGPCLDDVKVTAKRSGSTLKVTFTEQGGDQGTLNATKS